MYKRAIILGGGHSTVGCDFELLTNEITFGLNYTFKLCPLTCLIFDNRRFYRANQSQVDQLDSVKISHHCNEKGIIYVPPSNRYYGSQSLAKKAIYTDSLTGIYAITLVSCLGFEEIYLLGYDMNMSKAGTLHNPVLKHPHNSLVPYRGHLGKFDVFKKLTTPRIYNVNPSSAINVFPKIDYTTFKDVLTNVVQKVNQGAAKKWLVQHLEGMF